MPDLTLHGNSVPCPACEGEGRMPSDRPKTGDLWLDTNTCRACRGLGRVPRPVEEIIAEMREG